MKNIVSEIMVILAELGFNRFVLRSPGEIIILFYESSDSENIIFGISNDKRSEYIDMGALALDGDDIIFACSHGFSVTSDLKVMIPQCISQIKDSIEASCLIDYLDDEMMIKQKFSNVNMIIENFAQKINYAIAEETE